MDKITVDLYANVVNAPVIQWPGRRFPGVVVQDDTLHLVLAALRACSHALEVSDMEEAREHLEDALGAIEPLMAVYERTVRAHGIDLPYSSSE